MIVFFRRPKHSTPLTANQRRDNPHAAVGKNVAELRDKIQEQLHKRDSKKPTGGVDVGGGEKGQPM